MYYVKLGCELAGFVATPGDAEEGQEGYVLLGPISKGRDGRSDEEEVRRWARAHIGGDVVTLSIAPGAIVRSFEATFLKVRQCFFPVLSVTLNVDYTR